jgi:hypothetical protein
VSGLRSVLGLKYPLCPVLAELKEGSARRLSHIVRPTDQEVGQLHGRVS